MNAAGLVLRQTGCAEGSMAHGAPSVKRRSVLETLGLALEDLVSCQQVHGKQVQVVTGKDRGRLEPIPDTDGLVTRAQGLAVMVLGADCPLVCLYDPAQPAVAVLHAGWRGIVAGVLTEGMAALAPDADDRGKPRAFLGPCAGPCCYEVGQEVADQFRSDAVIRRKGSLYLDLPRAVELELGLPLERVGLDCTICGKGAYSHRRDGTANRHALIAALVPRRKP